MFDAWKWKKALSEVADEVDTLKRRVHTMEVEWMDTLDRLKRMMGRMVKERARAEAAQPDVEVAEHGELPPTSSIDPISANILRRRSRIAAGGREQ